MPLLNSIKSLRHHPTCVKQIKVPLQRIPPHQALVILHFSCHHKQLTTQNNQHPCHNPYTYKSWQTSIKGQILPYGLSGHISSSHKTFPLYVHHGFLYLQGKPFPRPLSYGKIYLPHKKSH